MSPRATIRVLVFTAVALACAPFAHAQCLNWRAFPHDHPEFTGQVRALQVFDDGSGPALYLAGDMVAPKSGVPPINFGVLRWDGHAFSPVGTLGEWTHALATFNDGTGPALYVATRSPARVLKWNGSTWVQLGAPVSQPSSSISCLAVHDDGSGAALYAGGRFFEGSETFGVAKWDGTNWVMLSNGPGVGVNSSVFALASFDDGTGPGLYAGGSFQSSIGSPSIAKWKLGTWVGVGGGTNGGVYSLAVWDDGSGKSLYAVGSFTTPALRVARWNGLGWLAVGAGLADTPLIAKSFDLGGGSALYVATYNNPNVPLPKVERWDGSAWTTFMAAATPATAGCAEFWTFGFNALAAFDEGAGPRLFAGTSPGSLGEVRCSLSRANNGVWERVASPPTGVDNSIASMIEYDDGFGPSLYAGGNMCLADEAASAIVRWTGTAWARVGNNPPRQVSALAKHSTLATGTRLVAATNQPLNYGTTGLVHWDGATWTHVIGSSLTGDVFSALAQFGPDLYVGGSFTVAQPGLTTRNLIRWNPSGGYSAVGTVSTGTNFGVGALATFNDGTGLALYAGGGFTSADGVAMNRIGRWSGTSWSPLGSGVNDIVDALCVFDDGSGSALYAAGDFTTAGGVPALRVARWNGSSWSALGAGFDAQVLALGVFDDGSGPALYAGGNFTFSGTTSVRSIARWNGTSWTNVGGGITGAVSALCAHDDGTGLGASLFAAGNFTHAGALRSDNFAAWRGCGGTISKFCFGDGSDGYCPCANQGLSGRGCDNSHATGGARLNATGATNPDTIELYVAGELPNAATLVFQGTSALSSPLLFGGGLRCAGGTLVRLYTHNAVNGIVSVPAAGDPSISARSASQGDPLTPGAVRTYQTWYRDPTPNFCTPPAGNVWNLSNAVRIVW